MAREILTDADVEKEIEKLLDSYHVALAKKEQRIRYRRRQYLYQLRNLEKHGKELEAAGITPEILDNLDIAMKEGVTE